MRADARRHAEARRRIDGHRVRGAIFVGVGLRHRRKTELLDSLGGEREANHAPAMSRHEVDEIRRRPLGGANQVAFVFAILVIGDDDHPPVPEILDRLFDSSKFHIHQAGGRSNEAGGTSPSALRPTAYALR